MTSRETSSGALPSRDGVTARLRRCAELSRGAGWQPLVDLSPAAVNGRMRECAEISKLALGLAAAGAAVALAAVTSTTARS